MTYKKTQNQSRNTNVYTLIDNRGLASVAMVEDSLFKGDNDWNKELRKLVPISELI